MTPGRSAERTGVEQSPDSAALAIAAAERFVAAASRAIETHGRFVVALSGGSTPRRTFEQLASEAFARRVDWARVYVVWGDERCVGPDDPESNYRMAREALLDHVPVPAANVHRIRGEDEPARAAAAYERVLRELLHTPAGPPASDPTRRLDLVLLGLGEDGHTASLFPRSPALDETRAWVLPVHADAVPPWRVTLTLPILNACAEIMFVVEGKAKAAILQRVLEGPSKPRELPSQLIAPSSGRLHWLIDADAGAQLDEGS
jgi:6-phosphogluconolactonase